MLFTPRLLSGAILTTVGFAGLLPCRVSIASLQPPARHSANALRHNNCSVC